MSRTIDERIVQMSFDNKDFEKNANQTIGTLDNLKDSLDFTKSGTVLTKVKNALSNIGLDGVTNAVNEVSKGFDALSVAATTAIMNITNRAVNAGITLAKSLSVDQITAGWSKYGAAIAAEQTIMSAVEGKLNPNTGEAYDMDSVIERIKKLQWYTDETSYSIEQMTNAIGSFTSSGVDLDVATQAIMGISNACADAGVSTAKAESAFIGFAKAIGSGKMTLSIWNNQLKTSGLINSERFKQSMLEAAAETGTLIKTVDAAGKTIYKYGNKVVTVANMTEFMNGDKSIFKTEAMIKALNSYSDTVDELYDMTQRGEFDTASEAIDYLTESYKKAGKEIPKSLAAFTRAQEAITLGQAIQSVKDAVSSKWSQTFEYIFGDYEEAKRLWTTLANEMWEWFASTGDKRNEILAAWHEGYTGFDILNGAQEGLEKSKDTLKSYEDQIEKMIEQDRLSVLLEEETISLEYFTAIVENDSERIGAALSKGLKNNIFIGSENLLSDQDIEILQKKLEKRDELLSNTDSEEEKAKIIKQFNIEMGDFVKSLYTYSTVLEEFDLTKMLGKDSNSYASTIEGLTKLKEAISNDSSELFRAVFEQHGEELKHLFAGYDDIVASLEKIEKVNNNLLLSGKERNDLLDEYYAELEENFKEAISLDDVKILEKEKETLTQFFNAIETKDKETVIGLFNKEAELLMDNMDPLPDKIQDLYYKIQDLKETDVISNIIKKYNNELENNKNLTNAQVKSYKNYVSSLEELSGAVSSKDIEAIYKLFTGKQKDSIFNAFGNTPEMEQVKNILSEINRINKDGNKSAVEKTYLISRQKEELMKVLTTMSELDEIQEAQVELNEELVNFFINAKSGYDIFLDAVTSGLGHITTLINTVREAWEDVFPALNYVDLINLTERFKDFIDSLEPTEEKLVSIKDLFARIFTVLKQVLSIFKLIYDYGKRAFDVVIRPLINQIKPIFKEILMIFEDVGLTIEGIVTEAENDMSGFNKILEDIYAILRPIVDLFADIVSGIHDFTSSLNDAEEASEDATEKFSLFKSIGSIIGKVFETVRGIVENFSGIIDFFRDAILGAWGVISKTISDIKDVLTQPVGGSNLNPLSILGLMAGAQGIFDFKWNITDVVSTTLKLITDFVGSVGEALDTLEGQWDSAAKANFAASFQGMAKAMLMLAAAILIIASIKEESLMRSLAVLSVLVIMFGKMVTYFFKLNKTVRGSNKGLFGMLAGNLATINFGLISVAAAVDAFAIAVLIIAASIKMLSTIDDPKKLIIPVIALVVVLEVVFKMMEKAVKLSSKKNFNKSNLKVIGDVLKEFAFALIELAIALRLVGSMNMNQITVALIGLLGSLAGIMIFISLLNKLTKGMRDTKLATLGAVIKQFGLALIEIALALKIVGSMNMDELKTGLIGLGASLGGILVFIAALSLLSKKVNPGTLTSVGAAMLMIAPALLVISAAIAVLGLLPFDRVLQGVGALAALILVLTGLTAVVAAFQGWGIGAVLAIGAAFVLMATSMLILSKALDELSVIMLLFDAMGPSFGSSLGKLVGLLFALVVPLALLGAISPLTALAGGSLIVLGKGIEYIGNGVSKFLVAVAALEALGDGSLLKALMAIEVIITKAVTSAVAALVSLIPSFIVGIVDGIESSIVILIDAITGIVDILLKIIVELAPKFIATILTLVWMVLDAIQNNAGWIINKIGVCLEVILGSLGNLVGLVATGILDFLINSINGVANAINSNAEGFGEALGNLVTSIIDALAGTVRGYLKTREKAGSDVAGWLFDMLFGDDDTQVDIIVQKAEGMTEALSEGIEDNKDTAIETSEEVGEEVSSAFEDVEGAEESAKNTLEGLIEGLNPQTHPELHSRMRNYSYEWAEVFKTSFDEGMDSHSPSREMAKRGTWAIQGFLLGIENNLSDVAKSGIETGEVLLDSVSKSIEIASQIPEDLDPVITPVLDLSQIQNGTKVLSNMLSSDRTIGLANSLAYNNGLANGNLVNSGNDVTLNATFNVEGNMDESMAKKFADIMVVEINEKLGQMI